MSDSRERFEEWAIKEGVFASESEDVAWAAWQAAELDFAEAMSSKEQR